MSWWFFALCAGEGACAAQAWGPAEVWVLCEPWGKASVCDPHPWVWSHLISFADPLAVLKCYFFWRIWCVVSMPCTPRPARSCSSCVWGRSLMAFSSRLTRPPLTCCAEWSHTLRMGKFKSEHVLFSKFSCFDLVSKNMAHFKYVNRNCCNPSHRRPVVTL